MGKETRKGFISIMERAASFSDSEPSIQTRIKTRKTQGFFSGVEPCDPTQALTAQRSCADIWGKIRSSYKVESLKEWKDVHFWPHSCLISFWHCKLPRPAENTCSFSFLMQIFWKKKLLCQGKNMVPEEEAGHNIFKSSSCDNQEFISTIPPPKEVYLPIIPSEKTYQPFFKSIFLPLDSPCFCAQSINPFDQDRDRRTSTKELI